jgi:hypothetical protein
MGNAVYTNNFFNIGTMGAGTGASLTSYAVIRNIHIANNTAGALTFQLFLGATGGTAVLTALAYNTSVAANSVWDWYGQLEVRTADFISGGGSATGLVITITGEVGLV